MAPVRPGVVIWMRPEQAAAGRPAQHSREEITAAAVTIADQAGLDAVSMRRVAAELGTGAASLYRYLDTREDLLDLMIDFTGSEYVFAALTGDWLADVIDIGQQARAIMRRHPWLPSLVITHSVLGPNGLVLLEHVLGALAPHPAGNATKLEAFAILTAVTALFVQNERGGGSARQQRNAAYLRHALATGRHPRLEELLAPESSARTGIAEAAPGPADRYGDILARILTGILALEPPSAWPQPSPRGISRDRRSD
jgi:AcrR family transcriptional regulator